MLLCGMQFEMCGTVSGRSVAALATFGTLAVDIFHWPGQLYASARAMVI